MKKISVVLILTMLCSLVTPAVAGTFEEELAQHQKQPEPIAAVVPEKPVVSVSVVEHQETPQKLVIHVDDVDDNNKILSQVTFAAILIVSLVVMLKVPQRPMPGYKKVN